MTSTSPKIGIFTGAVLLLFSVGMNVSAVTDLKPLNGITLHSPQDYQVFQRQTRAEGRLLVSGRCAVACERMEARLRGPRMNGESLAQKDWIIIPFDPATGTFNFTVSIPAGGWYDFDVRAWNGKTIVGMQNVPHVGIGEVFVGAGQSNSTNCGGVGSKSPLDGRTKPESGKVSTFDGTSWRIADDPQPGTHDQAQYALGSFWPAFGDAMTAKYKVPIGVAVTGHGGTSINRWKKDGELFNWTLTRMRQLGPQGFRAVLWHQGENDAGMPAQAYADGLGQIIRDFRQAAGWELPWFAAQVSFIPNKPTIETGPRGGQKMLWEQKVALAGPDTDVMLGDLRDNGGKGIHFSKKGLNVHGNAWAEKVSPWLDKLLELTDPPKAPTKKGWWRRVVEGTGFVD